MPEPWYNADPFRASGQTNQYRKAGMGKNWIRNHDNSAVNIYYWCEINVHDDKKEKTGMLYVHGAALLAVPTDDNSSVFRWAIQRDGRVRTHYSLRKHNCLLTGTERGEGQKNEFTQRHDNEKTITPKGK